MPVHHLFGKGGGFHHAVAEARGTVAANAIVVRNAIPNSGDGAASVRSVAERFAIRKNLAMLAAIVYGLTPDDKWDARHNPGSATHDTRWGPVLGVIVALMLGAAALMATVAFSGQRYFEWQVEEGRKLSQ